MSLLDSIVNPIERKYFAGLLSKKDESGEKLSIHTDTNPSGVYPTAIAPKELVKHLPWKHYEDVKRNYAASGKVNASLWLRKMHGGIGSSIKRNDYLKEHGRDKVGAKGTDLFIQTSNGPISIAEAQLIQASKKVNSFESVIFQDILNEDVVSLFDTIWDKVNPQGVTRFQPLIQTNVPTLGEDGELTRERQAPAGHGLFGYEILNAIFDESLRPNAKNLICCIGNGEDLSSTPDKAVVNWMIKEEVPICMVTTTKTKNDMKGGQIALWDKGSEGVYLTIIEKAQAEEANQLELFSEIGLREGDKGAFFNTNLVLLNIDVLVKKMSKLDKEELLEASLPDLILNKKEQDGKNFTQLEGAMGSVFLNLDKYWRKNFNTPLIHIMNVSKGNRTRFFSPIKSAFDYFMQYHSDRFTFNEETFHLVDNFPGKLPRIEIPSDYKDISVVIDDFKGSKLGELESLVIEKRVNFKDKNLIGHVR
jgi:hypothetical protein